MKALFIGYSKCGTKTMTSVFRTLGYSCYDFPENFGILGEEWTKIFNEGATVEDFKQMFADVDSSVDFPAFVFWEEILEAFPDTKLLVMYRDEESWFKSFVNQLKETRKNKFAKIIAVLSPSAQRMARVVRLFSKKFHNSKFLVIKIFHLAYHVWGGDRNAWPWQTFTDINLTLMRHRYRQHNLYVQQKAPIDQLHVVDFKQGWEPICKFLEKPVPDVPFPHENKGGEIGEEYLKTHPIALKAIREVKITVAILALLLAIGCYCILS